MSGKPQPFLARFEAKYEPAANGCWIWLGSLSDKGYGRIRLDGHDEFAHRAAWMAFKGPIPEGLEIDHLCTVRCCVNPSHLEPVTRLVNVRRSRAGELLRARMLAKVACPHGHSYDGAPVDANGWRICMVCRREKWRKANAKRSARRGARA